MNISIVSSTDTHEIRFLEFIAPTGWTITSFFQIVEKPDTGIGCADTYQEALCLLGYPSGNDEAYIYAAYLQTIGVGDFDYLTGSCNASQLANISLNPSQRHL